MTTLEKYLRKFSGNGSILEAARNGLCPEERHELVVLYRLVGRQRWRSIKAGNPAFARQMGEVEQLAGNDPDPDAVPYFGED